MRFWIFYRKGAIQIINVIIVIVNVIYWRGTNCSSGNENKLFSLSFNDDKGNTSIEW